MAVPKGKVSKARRDKRRSSVWKLQAPNLSACPKCGAMRLPHSAVLTMAVRSRAPRRNNKRAEAMRPLLFYCASNFRRPRAVSSSAPEMAGKR